MEFSIYYLQLSLIITAFGIIVSTMEELYKFEFYTNSGLMSWEIGKLRSKFINKFASINIVSKLLEDENYYYITILKLISSISLIIFVCFSMNLVFPLGLISICLIIKNIRNQYGLSGAHHMRIIIIIPSFLASLYSFSEASTNIVIIFISIQLTLSYFIAGYSKLWGEKWRNGTAVEEILSTDYYGDRTLGRFFYSHKMTSKIVTWSVIFLELLFPILLFNFFPNAECFLIIYLFFHILNGVFMGLNDFIFAFGGAYPAIFYLILNKNIIITTANILYN